MTNILQRWLDSAVGGLGYVKADDVRGGPSISAVWGGEAPQSSGLPLNNVALTDSDAQRRTERLAITSAWAYSDINLIAREFSRALFGVYEQSGEGLEAQTAHPFETLLSQPNQFMGTSFLWQYSIIWLLLRGEAYWWAVPDTSGELAELWPIPANRMRPIPDAKTYLSGYAYHPRHGQKPVRIPTEMVCFFRLPNPFDYHRGLSPGSAARMALETDLGAASWNRSSFENEATLRMLLSLPKEMNPRDFETVKAELIEELVQRKRRFLIARSGDVKAEQFGLSHDDMEFLSGREFTREEIDRVFGVPAGFWAKEATRANSEAAKATLIESTVYPLHVMFAEALTAQVLRPRYGEAMRGQFEDIRPKNRSLIVQERRQNWQVKTFNQARSELGESEYDGPLAETIGDLPLPLATNPQFVMAMAGIIPSLPMKMDDGNRRAVGADLRRWKSIALRRLREGSDPAGYEFESDHIPAATAAAVKAALTRATDAEEVKAAFAVGFRQGSGDDHRRSDWSAYP